MGRATIIGGGTNGLFTVEVDYGKAARDALVFVLSLRIAEQTALIAEQTVRVDQAATDTAAARELASIAVRDYAMEATANPGGKHSALVAAVTRLTVDAARLAAIEAQLRVKRDLLKVDRTEQQREKGRLESAVVSATKSAWCVDLTESAAGTVATVDIPGEDQALLLAPGCRAPMAADGKLLAREVMTPAQAFFNAAVLPGWQKWKPTYRKGAITSINKSTSLASVALDAATSSAAGLGVNRASSLSNVPVVYMTCNAEVFEVGNRVVVEFVGMAQESPRVIGFVSNPKPCVYYMLSAYAGYSDYSGGSGSAFNESAFPHVTGSDGSSGVGVFHRFYGGAGEFTVTAGAAPAGYQFLGWTDGDTSGSKTYSILTADTVIQALYVRIATAIPIPRLYFAGNFPHPTNPSLIGPPSWVIYLDTCAVNPALPCSTTIVVSHEYVEIARGGESAPDIGVRPSGPATVQHTQTIGPYTYAGPVSYNQSGVYSGNIEMYSRAG